jgi:putative restriction endonuclease
MGNKRLFGHISDYAVNHWFESRKDMSKVGLHRPLQAGISGSGNEGADSIVLSGGYEDDEDYGNVIIYTGQGGRDLNTGKQIADQLLTLGNLALAKSRNDGLPVRVIRGWHHKSPYSPEAGYVYAGLFKVEDCWREIGRSGYHVWRYRLVNVIDTEYPDGESEQATQPSKPVRRATSIQRIVRDTRKAQEVKERYDYCCQVCRVRLEGLAGPYAEAAHIIPLGKPHDGPDTVDNIICLCPNHHVLFDLGTFAIADDLSLIGIEGHLYIQAGHSLSREYLKYHRERYGSQHL